jgi:hypothetical protein
MSAVSVLVFYFFAGGHESDGGVFHVEAGGGTSSFGVFVPAGASFAAGFRVALPFAPVSYGCQRGGNRAALAAA